jgi:transposase-like protein
MECTASKINGFTPDQALDVLPNIALDQSAVTGWITDCLHPGPVPICPGCGEPVGTERPIATFRKGGRVKCAACNKFFTNRTNSILHKSVLTDVQVYLIAALLAFAQRTGTDRFEARRVIADIVAVHKTSIRNWEMIFSALESPLV